MPWYHIVAWLEVRVARRSVAWAARRIVQVAPFGGGVACVARRVVHVAPLWRRLRWGSLASSGKLTIVMQKENKCKTAQHNNCSTKVHPLQKTNATTTSKTRDQKKTYTQKQVSRV